VPSLKSLSEEFGSHVQGQISSVRDSMEDREMRSDE
jgi:hypothetical protein